jgi:hypothetical protein
LLLLLKLFAGVAKLVDAPDLGSGALGRVGSSPITRTKNSQYYNYLRLIKLFGPQSGPQIYLKEGFNSLNAFNDFSAKSFRPKVDAILLSVTPFSNARVKK